MLNNVKSAVKLAMTRTPLSRFVVHRYPYNFTPRQLAFLTECIDRTAGLSGAIALRLRRQQQEHVDRQLALGGISRVRSIQADAAELDYAPLAPLSFAIVDVDLYLPVRRALEKIVPLVRPGGVVVVDDCVPGHFYDGAHQAYSELVAATGRPSNIIHEKLGVIEV